MPHDRFFLDAPLEPHTQVSLEGDEAHHLMRVMRKKVGEKVELVNGQSQLAVASIHRLDKREVSLDLLEVELKNPSSYPLIICQAIPRLNRLDTLVEKGVELGMTALWLFPGQLSEKKELSPTQFLRLRGIAIAAMKQSGRLDLPAITLMPPLSAWTEPTLPAYFGDFALETPPLLSLLEPGKGMMFFVGPEAGFTEQEKGRLRQMNVQPAKLHANILRTETASLAALSIASNFSFTKN